MRLAQRVLACVLVLFVSVEASGMARALGPGADVHCCCGTHASARPCPCPDCPMTVRRAALPAGGPTCLSTAPDCNGHRSDEAGVLSVLAVVAPLVALPLPKPLVARFFAAPRSLASRTVDVARPPP